MEKEAEEMDQVEIDFNVAFTNIVLAFAFDRITIKEAKRRYGFGSGVIYEVKKRYKNALRNAIIQCAEDLKDNSKNPFNYFYRCVWSKVYEYVKQHPYKPRSY